MGVFANIHRVLDTQLKNVSSNPFVSWPNAEVRPGNSALSQYVRPTLLLSNTELYTLNNHERIPGIYQIDIYGQLNRGIGSVFTLADEIKEHFEATRELKQDSTTVMIQSVSMGPALKEEAWFRVFLEINFICYNEE